MDQPGSMSGPEANWRMPGRNEETSSSLLSEAIARAAAKTPVKTPSKPLLKTRSLSDSIPQLSPSPRFQEPSRKANDDNTILETPVKQLGKFDSPIRGLSLQMPARDISLAPGYSPQVEGRDVYSSPSSAIPRHSRGLDYSRVATHLHHSTIAEQVSPESSPTITHKTLAQSSRRTSSHSMMLDSPRLSAGWMSAGNSYVDRPLFPRSMGSTTAINSDSSGSDSGDSVMEQDNPEEAMISTPQVSKFDNPNALTPFGVPRPKSLLGWPESNSPISQAFTSLRQTRRPNGRGRHSSDSTESHSRITTPDPQLNREGPIGYFGRDSLVQNSASRRESLSIGTHQLHISSSNDDADESGSSGHHSGVIRRPVTRRSNLLPKTKTFARIRAALHEEGAPLDSESRREAEVVKQAFAHYNGPSWGSSTTAPPSPDLTPTIPSMPTESSMSDVEGLGLSTTTTTSSATTNLSRANTETRRGSVQKEFWSSLYNNRLQTPPPQLGNRARSSSGVSEDLGMDSPSALTPQTSTSTNKGNGKTDSESTSTELQSRHSVGSLAEVTRRIGGKRRRDDDFDTTALKRRAVSPGISVQSSPVMSQSPTSNGSNWWGQQKSGREPSLPGSANGPPAEGVAETSRPSMTPVLGPKRIGLQGMADTSDGLMKMSID